MDYGIATRFQAFRNKFRLEFADVVKLLYPCFVEIENTEKIFYTLQNTSPFAQILLIN